MRDSLSHGFIKVAFPRADSWHLRAELYFLSALEVRTLESIGAE
jgi:hypothetical protein